MKKIISIALSICIGAAAFTSCGTTPAPSQPKASSAPSKSTQEPQVVSFWYNHKGDEAKVFEDAIAAYNSSQTKYKVEGLSVTDQQKVIVALASNEAPDVIQGSNSNIITYQANGLLKSLQEFIDKESFDVTPFAKKAIAGTQIKGEQYGLPFDQEIIQMFYNKDILKEIGYSEPPKTVDEMYEMAIKATQVDASGNITLLGYPLFPLASARQELIYAFGGRFWAEDGVTLTPDDPKIVDSLKMNVKFREKYGIDKVQAFVATANTNRYTEQDMFFAGKQLFRIDGQWLPTMIQKFNSKVNWGVTLLPSATGDETHRGTSRYEVACVSMPISAKNPEGGWDFMKWLTAAQGGAKMICMGNGWLPANEKLYDDPEILACPGFTEFIEALRVGNFIQYPIIADTAKYTSTIEEHLDYVYTGAMTPEEAMAQLKTRTQDLK